MKKRNIFWPLFLLLMIAIAGRQEQVAAAPVLQGTNLLKNSSFEQPYVDGTAQSWNRWHRETPKGDAGCETGYHYKPKWLIETNSDLVADGVTSQKVGNTWDTWHAGVFQTVDVTPGETYRFTVLARGRVTNENYPQPSEQGINMNVQVGIDPNGSGVWHDGDVVWGGTGSPHDTWQSFSVEATATGDKMSVFTAANFGIPGANQCRKYIDVWFDKAELVSVGPAPTNTPPPPPPATAAPAATPTPLPSTTSEVPSTEPPTTEPPPPTPEASPTADLSAGGTICVNAFDDVNGNGQRDATEGFMPGVNITVAATNGEAIRIVTEGGQESRCFAGLEPGIYQAGQQVPDHLQMTTAANTSIESIAGSTTQVIFGSRSRSGAPVATAPSGGEVIAEVGEPGGSGTSATGDESGAMQPTTGAMLCVNAFHDENGNGLHETNEGYMAGVTLRVTGEGGFAEETVSEGEAAPYCIDNLAAGAYEITQTVPHRVILTTADSAIVSLTDGKTVSVEFGSRLDLNGSEVAAAGGEEAANDSGEANAQPSAEGPDLLLLGGLGVVVIGVVLLGVLLFLLLRR